MPAIPVHHTDTVDQSWDADENIKRIPDDAGASVLRRMYAWVDPDADPATKSAYKLPHHEVDSDGNIGPANLRACIAAIAALNGARGGVDIPEADREAVWRHLAAHLEDANMEPPPLKRSGTRAFERRAFTVSDLEVRAEGDRPRIVGYAAVFNEPSEDLGGFREIIRPGAFRKTIKEADVRALWNHDPNYVLGRTKSGTLKLEEDERGLRIEIIPPNTTWARDLLETIRRGDVDQMSFGFRTIRDRWTQTEQGVTRELLEVALFDVSPVTFPAYPQTEVQVRSAIAELLAHVDRLTRFLPAVAPPLAGHPAAEEEPQQSAPDPRQRITLLRRRLELAERSI